MRWLAVTLVLAGCAFQPSAAADAPPGGNAPDAAARDAPIAQDVSAESPTADAGSGGSADATPWLAGALYRKRIVVTAAAALAAFSVSLLDPGDADLAAHGTAADLQLTAGDGTTLLPREVVAYDAATGSLEAWTETALAAGSTAIYLYYGGGPATPAPAMWSHDRGVWHLGGTGAGADSTAFASTAQVTAGSGTPALAAGIAGDARAFVGAPAQVMTIGEPADHHLDFGTGSFTFRVWVSVSAIAGPFDMPLHKGGSSMGEPGFDMELGSGAWNAEVVDDAMHVIPATFGAQPHLPTGWVQLAAVCDRAQGKLLAYVDGTLVTAATLGGTFGQVSSTSEALTLSEGTYPFDGDLDEVRITPAALTQAWLAAEHANLADRASFLSIGPEQAR